MSKDEPKKYRTKARKTRIVSKAMSALGRIGGKARAEKMTPAARRASAIKASRAAAKARTKRAKIDDDSIKKALHPDSREAFDAINRRFGRALYDAKDETCRAAFIALRFSRGREDKLRALGENLGRWIDASVDTIGTYLPQYAGLADTAGVPREKKWHGFTMFSKRNCGELWTSLLRLSKACTAGLDLSKRGLLSNGGY
jgi:hypothetical protein